jgi:uncharacterized Fe-S cluster protein YjdI
MKGKRISYSSRELDVHYDVDLCIHAAECVRGLPQVFDPKRKPWVAPDNASADELITVIEKCPTGALSYTDKTDLARNRKKAIEELPVSGKTDLCMLVEILSL